MFHLLLAVAGAAACAPPSTSAPAARAAPAPAEVGETKTLTFAILEDYEPDVDSAALAADIALFHELGITTWRGSIGWDDVQPRPGEWNLAWLRRFARQMQAGGIELRPYLAYTPEWAGVGRTDDGHAWNDPPRELDRWGELVDSVARTLSAFSAAKSLEFYNEENVPLWWDGTAAEYARTLARGTAVTRAVAPRLQLLLGGMVWPDAEWVEVACAASPVDVVPFHAYPETWTPESVTVETYLADYPGFLASADTACGPRPIWINETGFATTKGRTERDQAAWWARAIATFAAAPRVEHIGVYEIKDLEPSADVIGDAENYHLGLTRVDRRKKEAFFTVRRLVALLAGEITVRDAVLPPAPPGVHRHLFARRDGRQVLVAWVRRGVPATPLALPGVARGFTVREYGLDGSLLPGAGQPSDELTITLAPGVPRIFELVPSDVRR